MEKSDEELLESARCGSRPSWAELFERHQARIYRFALQMSGSPAMADEVVQDTFLDLLRGGLRFDAAKGSLGAFLLGVARIKSLKQGRYAGRTVEAGERMDSLAAPLNAALDAETRQRDQALRDAIVGLPEQFREAVVLCELSELSYEEAAAVIGCPVGTVRSRLHRARHLLLERLVERGIHGVH
jgi:RNA polymerase sigma-70 factor, ECF subfamily